MVILQSINRFINFKPEIYDNYGMKIRMNDINKKLIATILPVAIENSLQTVSSIIIMAIYTLVFSIE